MQNKPLAVQCIFNGSEDLTELLEAAFRLYVLRALAQKEHPTA